MRPALVAERSREEERKEAETSRDAFIRNVNTDWDTDGVKTAF